MNLLFLPEEYHTSNEDGGADICFLGKVWTVLYTVPEVQMLLVLIMRLQLKRNFIVSAITTVFARWTIYLIGFSEGIYNETSNHYFFIRRSTKRI
jgi:hypothetical protein